MHFSDLIGWCFAASIFMMWRFSKYSRILIHNKSLEPEEQARYRKKAQVALGAAGGFLVLSALNIVLAVLFQ